MNEGGISRRSLIKRGAVTGGTVLWAAPVVQSFTNAVGAQAGTPKCDPVACVTLGFGFVLRCTPSTTDDANCLCCCSGFTGACSGCSHAATACNGISLDCAVVPVGSCP